MTATTKSNIRMERCPENRLVTQAEAIPRRAIIESTVIFPRKADTILHNAIAVNTALTDKPRILSNDNLNVFFVLTLL